MATHAGGHFSAEHEVPITEPIKDTASPISYAPDSTGLVFLGSDEAEERLRRAKEIESYMWPTQSRFYCENVVTILLIPLHKLQKGGTLCAERPSVIPSSVHQRLLSVTSPFCRHCKSLTIFHTLALAMANFWQICSTWTQTT